MASTTDAETILSGGIAAFCEDCEVRDLTLCAPLDDTEMAKLCTILHAVQVDVGGTIVEEQEPAEYVFNVTGGCIRLFKLLPDGRRAITGFLFPGDFLGLISQDVYAYSAEALTSTMLCRFPRRKLEALFESMPKLERRLLGMASNELAAAQEQMVLLGRKTAGEKLASFLSLLSARQKARHVDANPIILPMSRSDIADYLGLTTETVSRTFTQFKTKGFLSLQAQGRVLVRDEEALQDIAEGA